MKIKPILFSTPMVRAILDGRKVQTRRVLKHQPLSDNDAVLMLHPMNKTKMKTPINTGDILWVRETFAELYDYEHHPELDYNMRQEWSCGYWYKTDGELKDAPLFVRDYKWRPSIFMPKEACRLFLKVTNVSVERLQDISTADSIKEGIENYNSDITKSVHYKDYLTKVKGYGHPDHDYLSFNDPKKSFESLWRSINGKDSWNNNPFVWVYDFEVTEKPDNFIT